MSELRVHDFMSRSRANGPGLRAVIWLQGCSLSCPGCFNSEAQTHDEGTLVSVDQLFERLAAAKSAGIEGLTVSGGEPMEQAGPLRELLERVGQASGLSVILFTGYTWQEVAASAEMAAVLPLVDVLIAGRYDLAEHLAQGLRGSANKTTNFLSERYAQADLDAVPPAEVTIGLDGNVILSGIDPVRQSWSCPLP